MRNKAEPAEYRMRFINAWCTNMNSCWVPYNIQHYTAYSQAADTFDALLITDCYTDTLYNVMNLSCTCITKYYFTYFWKQYTITISSEIDSHAQVVAWKVTTLLFNTLDLNCCCQYKIVTCIICSCKTTIMVNTIKYGLSCCCASMYTLFVPEYFEVQTHPSSKQSLNRTLDPISTFWGANPKNNFRTLDPRF